jgi:hypothetical protein
LVVAQYVLELTLVQAKKIPKDWILINGCVTQRSLPSSAVAHTLTLAFMSGPVALRYVALR